MIKIEVRIRKTVGDTSVEHEYRAELPDTATAEQIQAVGMEPQQQEIQTEAEEPPMMFSKTGEN